MLKMDGEIDADIDIDNVDMSFDNSLFWTVT